LSQREEENLQTMTTREEMF